MRLLTIGAKTEIIEKIYNDNLYIVDQTSELDDAIYHLEVRFYNLVLIYEDILNNCIDLLRTTNKLSTAFVIVTKNITKRFEISCLNSGALFIFQDSIEDDLLMARLESIHRDNFSKKFYYKDYFMIHNKDKEVLDISNNELNIRGKACDILSYLVQNKHRPPVSREELLQTIWDEPELICPNIIDINISKIRMNLKKIFGMNMIKTVRHKGFKLVDM